ncbi:MAG: hypothetical protein ABIA63_00415, partial [bacterium]
MNKNLVFILIIFTWAYEFIPAQVYGTNKLQYDKFHWKYLQTTHFDIHYYKGGRDVAAFSAGVLENAYSNLAENLSYNIKKRIPIIIYLSHNDFEQTNVILEPLGENTGGFTEIFKSRVVVPFEGNYPALRHVLHHELTHAVMYELMFDNILNAFRTQAYFHIPLWVAEGLAESQSLGWDLGSDMYMIDWVINNHQGTPFNEFYGQLYMAYKGGMSFMNFMASQYGKESIPKFLKLLVRLKSVEKAFKIATRVKFEEACDKWLRQMKKIYWPEMGKRKHGDETGKQLTHLVKDLSYFNLQPNFSPDGKTIAFFSDRKDYPGIYLMDADSGKVLKILVQSGTTDGLESFYPFRSGLSWSPDGKKIVFVTKKSGSDWLAVLDVETKNIVNKYNPDLGKISSPHWSPSGEEIVFTGVKDAHTAIYILNLKTGKFEILIKDKSHMDHPKWSPDGSRIVFESNKPEEPDTYAKYYNLYIINKDGGGLRRITSNPFDETMADWSPTGDTLVFVSNRNGISNLYLMDVEKAEPKPITNTFGGCFTPSWCKKTNQIAISIFEHSSWNIYVINEPQEKINADSLEPTNYMRSLMDTTHNYYEKLSFNILPPDTIKDKKTRNTGSFFGPRPWSSDVSGQVSYPEDDDSSRTARKKTEKIDTSSFLSDTSQFKDNSGRFIERVYKPKYSFDMISLGLAAGYAGSFAFMGSGELLLSDILGNHRFYLSFGGSDWANFNDVNGVFAYYYLPYRTDIGLNIFKFTPLIL